MKKLVNRRSLTFFLVTSAALIAISSFLVGYTNGKFSMFPPFLIIVIAAITTFLFETALQRRVK